ncbi:MAG: hybrid sensor histidine kinase/response regulator [Burkholderia sp.]|nr:hybrid sensor histidine kinase/response regulator [Burkholderia sp.]
MQHVVHYSAPPLAYGVGKNSHVPHASPQISEAVEANTEGRAGEHYVQFYEEDTFLLEEVLGFIGTGLWAGEAGVVIASRSRLAELEQRLKQCGLGGGSKPLYAGEYFFLDADETLSQVMVDDWPNDDRFNEVIGGAIQRASVNGQIHVRAYGEMVAILCADGKQQAAIHMEQLWNNLAARHSFSLLCAYPMRSFSTEEDGRLFHEVCCAHSHVCLAESFTLPTGEDQLRRTIAILQQKANALECEVARRKSTEKALHKREQELSDFLENAVEGMHRLGADGKILWANKAELELLGYTPQEYIGHHIGEFHVDQQAIADILDKLRRGETLYDYPARICCKHGAIKHVLMHSNALVEDGKLVSTRCMTRDVTDRVRLEEELSQKLAELAGLDRRKDEFLAMLGHELRNPLAPIMTSLELMRMHSHDTAQIARSRDMIARQVTLMTRLVDDLLDVSRITRGKIELRKQSVSLETAVDRALEMTRPLIDERCHLLSLTLPDEPLWLFADPTRLSQVLANLLHNAAKYTNAGGCLALTARKEDDELVLAVSDNGIGLDPELREKVFDLFVQGADSIDKARGGMGLGLTLVRSLVHLHGGTVEARSAGPGRGSEFIVRLPLGKPSVEAIERNETESTNFTAGPERTILIVDDNIDAAESLGEFLKAYGHRITITHDGLSAIDKAARLRPDAIILDIGLPNMNGYQVAQRLRSDIGLTSSLLVAVTGYAQERDRVSAQAAGFDHHFAKPLDVNKLAAILNNMEQK